MALLEPDTGLDRCPRILFSSFRARISGQIAECHSQFRATRTIKWPRTEINFISDATFGVLTQYWLLARKWLVWSIFIGQNCGPDNRTLHYFVGRNILNPRGLRDFGATDITTSFQPFRRAIATAAAPVVRFNRLSRSLLHLQRTGCLNAVLIHIQ